MAHGPVPSSLLALQKAGLGIEDIDLWEINEAFAGQCVACIKDLGINPDRVNVNGGQGPDTHSPLQDPTPSHIVVGT